MGVRLITPAESYPVTRAEAKLYCKIDTTAEDGTVDMLIAGATQRIEGLIDKKIMPQTWEYRIDAFADEMRLPFGPVQSVTSVKYIDADGAEQTLDAAWYEADIDGEPPRIVRAAGKTWPGVAAGINKVIIRFVAGSSTVSPIVKQAILATISAGNDDRQADRIASALKTILFQSQAMSC